MNNPTEFYVSPIALGVCADIDPYSKEAGDILTTLAPVLQTCDWPGREYVEQSPSSHHLYKKCGKPVVRVATMESTNSKSDKKHGSSFIGLCECHKQMGMWSDADTAWGWD